MHKVAKALSSAVLFGAFIMLACGGGSAPREASAQPDQQMSEAGTQMAQADSKLAPAFSLDGIDGSSVSLEGYKGKVLIIDFWATWCPPCVKEIPHFVELYDSYKDQGLVIVGVSVDRGGPSVVESFVAKNNVTYPVAMANMDVVDAYEIYSGIPTTYIVDRNGMIVEKVIGYREKSFFEDHIKKLL
jgi:peroxiredoxin